MKASQIKVILAMATMLVFIIACGAPAPTEAPATDVPATEAAAPTESVPPVDVSASIQHTDVPVSLPENQSGEAADFNSSNILKNKTPVGGDRFTFERFERPFNADSMDTYFPELDIVYTQVFQDDMWLYGRVYFTDLSASGASAKYAMEIDTDINGKGDWLVIASKPSSTDWTVSGVRVYQDANSDVGGELPMTTDKTPVNGDGFETLFFDEGKGDNSDTAWVRLSPDSPNIIEFAINRAAFSNPSRFLVNFWAGNNLDPAKFDFSDHYTHEQAGAADNGLEYFYPIKEVAEIDNSCRIAMGFQPNGSEPGLCDTYVKQQEAASSPSGPSGPGGCSANPVQILACGINSDPSYSCSWNSSSCSCDCAYVGPK